MSYIKGEICRMVNKCENGSVLMLLYEIMIRLGHEKASEE